MHALGRIAPTANSDERYDNLLEIATRFMNTARTMERNQLHFQTKMLAAVDDLAGRVSSVEGAVNCLSNAYSTRSLKSTSVSPMRAKRTADGRQAPVNNSQVTPLSPAGWHPRHLRRHRPCVDAVCCRRWPPRGVPVGRPRRC